MKKTSEIDPQGVPDHLDQLEAVEAIRLGLTAAREGRVKPARRALAELSAKLGLRVEITDQALRDAE